MDNIVAHEGMEQKIVLTGTSVRDNETKQHQNLNEKHFSEWLTVDTVWLGMAEAQYEMC